MGYLFHFFRPNSLRLKRYDYSKTGYYFVTICTQGGQHLFGKIIRGKIVLNEFGKIIEKCLLELPGHYSNMKMDVYTIMPNHVHAIMILCDSTGSVAVGAGLKPAHRNNKTDMHSNRKGIQKNDSNRYQQEMQRPGINDQKQWVAVNHDKSEKPAFDERKDLKSDVELSRFNKHGAGFKPAPTATSFMSTEMNKRNHALSEIVRGFKTFSARRINEMGRSPSESVWQRGYYDRIIRDEKELNRIRAYVRLNPRIWAKI